MARSTAAATVALAFFLVFATTAAASPPTITYSIDGTPGTNGWYRGSSHGENVVLHWSVSLDATSTDCLAAVTVPGPTAGTTQTCWAENADGLTTAVTSTIKIDATPPTGLTARFSRKPDAHGWYNHPVTIEWSATDALSGIAGCSAVKYRGPDGGTATATGGCTDVAGNSAAQAIQLAYDATPPALGKVAERSTSVGNVVRWSSSSPSDRIVVRRAIRGGKAQTTVFAGHAAWFTDKKVGPGVQYRYSVRAVDEAGNSSRVVSVAGLPKVLTLQKTPYVPRAAPNPILRWGPVRGASYYNVQLFRGSHRIFAAWPTRHQADLPTTWKWSGHRFRLTAGRYTWYVWAGLGPRALAHYRPVGSASFVVPRARNRGHGKH
ncbi:MAG: hypothetical protein ACJ75G_06320 [Gaiellaceae bacterium]